MSTESASTEAIAVDTQEVLHLLKAYEVQLCKPIKSVGRYVLKADRGEGSMGSLFLTNIRLYFVNYTNTYSEVNNGKLVPPFEIHSFLDDTSSITKYDDSIDFINIYKICETPDSPALITLQIYCSDFRTLQFSLKDSPDVRCFLELLNKLLPSSYTPSSVNMISSAGQMAQSLTNSLLSTTNNQGKLPSMSKQSSLNTLRPSASSSNVLDAMSHGNFNYITSPDVERMKMHRIGSKSSIQGSPCAGEHGAGSTGSPTRRITYELPILWYLLSTQYTYCSLRDWETREHYWLRKNGNNYLRITLCNDSYQLSQTLPRSFVTLASHLLSDVTLLKSISNQLPCQRVPVICFAYYFEAAAAVTKEVDTKTPITTIAHVNCTPPAPSTTTSPGIKYSPITKVDKFHLLIRSVTLTEDVRCKLKSYIIPLAFFDVTSKLPSFSSIEKSYAKLHETCASKSKSSKGHFISNSGKWLKKVHLVLTAVKSIVKMITNESSVVLLEDTDRCWNPLISSLVQICIDPDRRTIKGFEALIAKEWLYLTGNCNKYPDAIKPPSNVMFTLFLDCVHQLLSYEDSFNGYSFEFTSLYLVRLFDLSFLPSNFQAATDNCITPVQSSISSYTSGRLKGLTSSFEDLRMGTKSPKSSSRRRFSFNNSKRNTTGFTSYTNPTNESPTPPPRKNRNKAAPGAAQQHSSMAALQLTQANGGATVNKIQTQSSSSIPSPVNLALPLTIDGLNGHQLLFYFNPLFDGGQQIILKIPSCIASIIFFDALYLRWHRSTSSSSSKHSTSSIYYSMFPLLQQICLTQLHVYRVSCGLEESASLSNGHAKFVRLRSCGDTSSRSLSCANSIDSSLDYSETEL